MQNVPLRSKGLTLSCFWKWGERDPGNERDQRSGQADFLSVPDSLLTDSHFATHAWDSKVSLLTGYLFTADENQCRLLRGTGS